MGTEQDSEDVLLREPESVAREAHVEEAASPLPQLDERHDLAVQEYDHAEQEYEEHEVLESSLGLREIECKNITEDEHFWQESKNLKVHEPHVAERTSEQHGIGNQTGLTHQKCQKSSHVSS